MALPYSFRYALQSFYKEKWINFLSILAVASSLLVIILTFVFLYNVEVFTRRLPERFSLVLYLKDEIPQQEIDAVLSLLKARQDIESTKYISKEEAFSELKGMLKEKGSILEGLEENPLPASIEVKLKKDLFTTSTVKNVSDSMRGLSAIDDVYYGERIAEAIDLLKRSVEKIALVMFAIFLSVVIFVTYSTVKILFYRRKEEIDILKLLGATGRFIRVPFVIEGGVIGFSGGLLGIAGSLVVSFVFINRLGSLLPFLKGVAFPQEIIFALPVVGLFLGIIGSLIAIGKMRF